MFVGHVLPFDLAWTCAYAQVLALARKPAAELNRRMPVLPPLPSPTDLQLLGETPAHCMLPA